MAGKKYRLEDDLLKKSRPKWNSARYRRLEDAAQGGFCQKRIANNS